jgi:hypothetical protein
MSSRLREPILHPTPALSLRPTQMTLGMTKVNRKRAAWNKKTSEDLPSFSPLIWRRSSPGSRASPRLIDHRHLARVRYDGA